MTLAKYRHALPQMGDGIFLTDGGLETTLVFHRGLDLPHFAAFGLLRTDAGRAELARYYAPYVEIAKRDGRGLVLDTATWRSNSDWGATLGYSPEALDAVNAKAVDLPGANDLTVGIMALVGAAALVWLRPARHTSEASSGRGYPRPEEELRSLAPKIDQGAGGRLRRRERGRRRRG